MKTLAEQLASYAAYHRDPWNRLTHFFGVPVIIFSILVPLAWPRLAVGGFEISLAMLLVLVALVYYVLLDRLLGLVMVPLLGVILFFSNWIVATFPFDAALIISATAFVGGWVVQLVGHVFEGRRPALVDNLWQIVVAPLFLVAEVLFMLGTRADLKQEVASRIGTRSA